MCGNQKKENTVDVLMTWRQKVKMLGILCCWMFSSLNYTANSYRGQVSLCYVIWHNGFGFFYLLFYLIEYFLSRQFTAFSFPLSKIDERDTIKTNNPAKGKDREYRIFWNTEYFSCKTFVIIINKIDTIVRIIRIRDIE